MNYNDTSEIPGSPTDYLIKRKIPHEAYSKYYNDIGVLVMEENIEFNGKVLQKA